jgi:hypothetical protein
MSRDIHIKTKKLRHASEQPVVRLTPEAYNVVVDICNESGLSIRQVVSEIIVQVKDRIVYDREGD